MLRNAWLSGAAGLTQCWAYLFAPGVSIVLVVLAFTFVGQALDEVLDPKLRRARGCQHQSAAASSAAPRPAAGAAGMPGAQSSTQGLGGGAHERHADDAHQRHGVERIHKASSRSAT